jgi:prepilin-type processing-associated H-X9-DG protein
VIRNSVLECPTEQGVYPADTQVYNWGVKAVNYGVPMDAWDYATTNGEATLFMSTSSSFTAVTQRAARFGEVTQPSSIFMVMDCATGVRGPLDTFSNPFIVPPFWPNGGASLYLLNRDTDNDGLEDSNAEWWTGWAPYNNADMRHGQGLNVGFVDGHAEKVVISQWVREVHWAFSR